MKLYLIRHGESEANTNRLHAGWQQVALTEKGKSQARQAGEYLKTIQFDKIFSSDLIRAEQTVQNALPDLAYETDSLLREINVGTLRGKTKEECCQEYGESYLVNKAAHDFTVYGGENEKMLLDRVEQFMSKIENHSFERVAVFAHEGFIRGMLEKVLDFKVAVGKVCFDNCMISVFEFKDGNWRLCAWNIGMKND